MLLPNGDRAVVDIRKLRDYCLDLDNPRGSGKARVFAAVLGLTGVDAPQLREKLLEVARNEEAQPSELDLYGQRYTIDFIMETKIGEASIRSGWIVLHKQSIPRLTTCYVKREKR
jgi:predicted NUDIX family NTP pyrophosphohydrolase